MYLFSSGDLAGLGACLDTYWQQKQRMAPGCEPASVTRMLAALRPLVYGASMAGAGGGGFLYVLMKDGTDAVQRVRGVLSQVQVCTMNAEFFLVYRFHSVLNYSQNMQKL